MAQVMVNFRMDEGVKKSMELACKEMGLSMTTAFTIFATKVGREKRIPFEITAEPCNGGTRQRSGLEEPLPDRGRTPPGLEGKKEQFETLGGEIRRSLTAIHSAIPSSITGLTMERIRLLCGDELKGKAAKVVAAGRSLFSERNAEALVEKDLRLLEVCLSGFSEVAEDIRRIEHALVPAMKARSGGDGRCFALYERQLLMVSRDFDEIQYVLERFLCSTARAQESARSVWARIEQAAAPVETPCVLEALGELETLILQRYDALDEGTKARLEAHYLQTLELTLEELGREDESGEKAQLCLRAVRVVAQVISEGSRMQREMSRRNLAAEVAALERLATMRGDVAGDVTVEDWI